MHRSCATPTPTLRLVSALLAAGLLLLGCGGSPPSLEPLLELDALARGPNRVIAYTSALVTGGSLAPLAPDENVLTALSLRLGSETSDCAQRSVTAGTTLAVQFGAPGGKGCALATGVVRISGTASITLQRQDPRLDIVSVLDLVIDGEPMAGSLVISTTNGNAFDLTSLVSLSGHAWKLLNFTGAPLNQGTGVTATGSTLSPSGGTRILEYKNVVQRFYGCHPYGGSVRLSAPAEGLDRTLTFLDATPQDDAASLTERSQTQAVTLPRAAGCTPRAN